MGGAKGVEVRPNSIRLTFLPGKPTLMDGDVPMRPTASNVNRANRLAAEIREKLKWGTFSMAEYFPANGITGASLTVGDHLDTWLKSLLVRTSTRVGYATAVRFWKAEIGTMALRALKHSDVLTALARHQELAGKTVNNRTSVLRMAFDLAVRDKLMQSNPMEGLPRARQQKKPVEPFSGDESARILAGVVKHHPGPLANMIEFWFRTGLRTSELFGLKWSSIDMVAGTALVHEARVTGVEESTTKTGKTREVRLDARALAALERQKAHTFIAGGHVFVDPFSLKPWANTQAFSRRVWVRLLKAISVRYRRPYNIRHTRATEMLMAGVNPAFAAKQLGHDINVFLTIYAKWLPGAQDEAEMAKLERTGT